MEFYLIRTREAFDTFSQKMADRYGKKWTEYIKDQVPQTFPCVVCFEIWYNNCYPDTVLLYVIEKRHFDDSTLWGTFDSVI